MRLEFHLLTGMSHFYNSTMRRLTIRGMYWSSIRAARHCTIMVPDIQVPKTPRRDLVSREHDAEHGESGFRDECLRFNSMRRTGRGDRRRRVLVSELGTCRCREHRAELALLLSLCISKVEGLRERRVSKKARRHVRRCASARSDASDDSGCYPRLTCGDEYAPPVCAKVIARAKCVQKQGTHASYKLDAIQLDIFTRGKWCV